MENEKTNPKIGITKENFSNTFNKILSRFNFEDLFLFFILFLLIDEGIDDDFLILMIILLILTDNT